MALVTDQKTNHKTNNTISVKDFLQEKPQILASLSWADTSDEDIDDYFKKKPYFADTSIQGSKSADYLDIPHKSESSKKRTGRRREGRNRNIILSKSESDADISPEEQKSGRFIVTDPGPSDPARAQVEIGRIRSLLVKDMSSDVLVSRTSNGVVCICDRRDIGDIKRTIPIVGLIGTGTDKK